MRGAEFTDALLARMTLREKLGQLTQAETATDAHRAELEERIRRGEVGSILMSVGATAGNTPQGEIDVDFYNHLQRLAVEEGPQGIPLLYGRDVIHGHRTVYPIPLAMAAAFDPAAVRDCYREIAEEAANDSVHWSFAPMLDLSRDPRWGRIIEGCGEDPYVGATMAEAVVRGLQGDATDAPDSVLACAKHFVGYGAAEGGRDYTHAEISDYALYNFYFPAFRAAIRAGAKTVMSAFNDINGEPVSASEACLTGHLRGHLGFDGMVVSDYGAVHQLIRNGVAEDDRAAAVLALNAGIDMDMVDFCYLDQGEAAVREGRISMETVDRAVRRVLRVKAAKGLFERPYCGRHPVDYAAHRDSARRMAARSAVLLENNGRILPLRKDAKLLLIGRGAEARAELHGSWALDGDVSVTPDFCTAMQEKLSGGGFLRYDRDCESTVTGADAVVFALCEDPCSTGENACISDISISDYERSILRRAKALGKPLVGVFFYGRPIAMQGIAEWFDAVLYAWHGGCGVAHAAADILFGDVNPSGRTPVTFPRLATHLPLYYNCYSSGHAVNSYYGENLPGCYRDSHASPYYPFGYGLTYSAVRCGKPVCDAPVLSLRDAEAGAEFRIRAEVENTGDRDVEEVVQLYVRDPVASVCRPLRELRGFCRVALPAGGRKTVEFAVGKPALGYYGKTGDFILERGGYDLYIGGDCLTENRVSVRIV